MPSLGLFNRHVPTKEQNLTSGAESVKILGHYLCESLKLRILNIPVPPGSGSLHDIRVAVLFSGGLDCTVLARMAHDLLPSEYEIDLLNVAFENPRVIQAAKNPPKIKKNLNRNLQIANSEEEYKIPAHGQDMIDGSSFESCPDRGTGRKTFDELSKVCPTRIWRFVAVCQP